MSSKSNNSRKRISLWIVLILLSRPSFLSAQANAPAKKFAKDAAPIDFTGYWVAIVTQDWRQRMVTPPNGDYASVPINAESKKIADAWDPAKDESAGEQCRAYGAPAVMRIPARLHVTWQDASTLKIEIDAGMQTRLLHFGEWKQPNGQPSWQGISIAEWEIPASARGEDKPPPTGSMKVITTHSRPGYLRKNGIPYSADAAYTEYWDLLKERNGEQWIEITSTVDDSKYLRQPWVTAMHFKKEPDGAKWDPIPCSATW